MMFKGTVAAFFGVLFLAGCATPHTGERVVDAGPQPTEEQAKQVIMSFLNSSLKDPDSIKQFRVVNGPSRMTWYRGLINGGGNDSAWLVCFEYNAKNSYGGYVGLKTDGIAMRVYGESASMVPWVNWGLADSRCM